MVRRVCVAVLLVLCASLPLVWAHVPAAPVFNVKDYGATGDGTTDDTTFIVNTFAAAGNNAIVYFPAGTYSTFRIQVTGKTGLTVRGQGHTSMLQRRYIPFTPPELDPNTEGVLLIEESSHVTVEYLGIDLKNCFHYCAGIGINNSTHFRIQYNRIIDSQINPANADDKFGILTQGGGPGNQIDTPSYVLHNILEDTQLEIDRVSNLLIQGNKVIRPRFTAGIGVFTNTLGIPSVSRNVMIVDNVIQDADVSGGAITIHLDPNNQTDFTYADYVIARNVILQNVPSSREGATGIKIGTGNTSVGTAGIVFRNFEIADNYIWAHPTAYAPPGFYGINLASGPAPGFVFQQFTIVRNTMVLPNSGAYGLYLRMLDQTGVRNNHVFNVVNAGSAGLVLVRGKHVQIADNTVTGSAGTGLYFAIVPAYDQDIRSWGNTLTGVSAPFWLESGPTGEYALQDYASSDVTMHMLSAATEQIGTWSGMMRVNTGGASAPLVMTSTPTLYPGRPGQRVTLINTADFILTLQDQRVLPGSGLYLREPRISLGLYAAASFIYDPALLGWVQDGDGAILPPRVITLGDIGDLQINSTITEIAVVNGMTQESIFRNPSGTPVDGQSLQIRVRSAAAQTLYWGTLFQGTPGLALPTSTTGGDSVDYWRFLWNADVTRWHYLGR